MDHSIILSREEFEQEIHAKYSNSFTFPQPMLDYIYDYTMRGLNKVIAEARALTPNGYVNKRTVLAVLKHRGIRVPK